MATEISAVDGTNRNSNRVIRKSVTVPLSHRAAFTLFTEGIGTWWPGITHSVAQSVETRAVMEPRLGGHISEESAAGTVTWGTITAWDPPESFTTTWHPGSGAELATELTVRFTADGPGRTRVELEHRGWEVLGEAADEQYLGYTKGWDPVLRRFVERADG